MTVGSFSVRAVGPHGQQLANVAAIATGPAAALALVKSAQPFPEGTRFHVRGGAPRRIAGQPITGYWLDEAASIDPAQWDALAAWARVEPFGHDPDDMRAKIYGDRLFAYVAILCGVAIFALQALRWWLS